MVCKEDFQELDSRRHIWNIWMFILSFVLSNIISGVIYDTYVNYLQEVARPVATSFWSYYGYATFISAMMLLLVNRIGYKRILIFCPITSFGAMISIIYGNSELLYKLMTVLSLVGLQLHYAVLAPYIAAHTSKLDKTLWYSRTYWIGYAGWTLMTYIGGALTVSRFAARSGTTFSQAQELTKHIEGLTPLLRNFYIKANMDVLFLTAVIAALSAIPVVLIKELEEDYRFTQDGHQRDTLSYRMKMVYGVIKNKKAVAYTIYWALINFGMGLFTPYYTVFLNRNLHIDRASASLLVSISYMAVVIFIIFTPLAVKKFGQTMTLAGVLFLSIPFMLLIANGDRFGILMIPVVGISLFMRSGLANLGSPIDSSLPMEIVSKDMRTTMSCLLSVVAGLASIVSGWFTGGYLFIDESGYKAAYYLAAGIYFVACIIILIVFTPGGESSKDA